MISEAHQKEFARQLIGTYTVDGRVTKIEAWYQQIDNGYQAVFKHEGDSQILGSCQLPEGFGNTLEELVKQHICFTLGHPSAEFEFNSVM